jgi:nucleoside-diphosphate-sugar epimerase
MKVAVVGGTGVLGRNVVPALVENGHNVRVLVRVEKQAKYLQQTGVETFLGDIFNRDTLLPLTASTDVVLHLATAIPREGSSATWAMNDRIRREGTRNLLYAATHNDVPRYIQQSITLLYGESADVSVTELSVLHPAPFIQSAADMEEMVRLSKLNWCILRDGIFYGPGTGTEDTWRKAARQSILRLPGDGSAFLSLIHVADMARAIVKAAEIAPPHSTFNVVDNLPVTYRELFGYISAQEGTRPPQPGGDVTLPSLACSNAAIRSELEWSPFYKTYRSGLAGSHKAWA